MKLEGKNIVIISPDSWDFLPVSKHHYARVLSEKNNVYFINPITKLARATKPEGNVKVIRKYKSIRGLSRLPKTIAKGLMKAEINAILKQVEGQIDVVWSFDSSRLYYLDLFNASVTIAHIVDFTEAFNLKELIGSANISLAPSDVILENLKKYGEHVYKINHGFVSPDSDKFSRKELGGKGDKKGVYIGNLDIPYFDWKALSMLATHYEDIDFVLIGPISDETVQSNKEVLSRENVLRIAKIPSEEVGNSLRSADFCFQLYDNQMNPDQLHNPHKTMQYLGSEQPVFVNFTPGYPRELLFEYKDKTEVIIRFGDFLENLEELQSDKERSKRRNFALANTYEMQIRRIEQLISEVCQHQ